MKKNFTRLNGIKPKVMITFREGGENGGPYVSHERIMNSSLKVDYEFVPIYIPRFRDIVKPHIFIKYVRQIRREQPDIYHFAGLQLEGFYLLFLAKCAGIKNTVCAIHGSAKDAMFTNEDKITKFFDYEKWTLKHSKITYGVSRFVSEWEVVQRYAHKCFGYIYNMPIKQKNSVCSDIREEFGFRKDDIVVVSTGRIIKDKGYDILSNIICSESDWKNVKFVVVGEGSLLGEMKNQVFSRGLDSSVVFTGYRSDIEVILRASDIFIICTYHETFCNSVVEASGVGLPVIATRTGGIPEIVEDGVNGYLINPGDEAEYKNILMRLINDRELRKRMGNAGAKLIEKNFAEEEITKKIRRMYEQCLS